MSPRLQRCTVFLTVMLLASGALSESALDVASPSAAPTSEGARFSYQKGLRAYASKHYAESIELFRDADRREPSAALSFNMARAYGMLGDDANALRAYRDYLRRATNPEDAADIGRLVDSLSRELAERGVQQVTVLSVPPFATVILDGEPVGVTPFTAEIPPGQHTVSWHLEGRVDAVRRFELPQNEAIDVHATLVPAPVAVAAPVPATLASATRPVRPPPPSARKKASTARPVPAPDRPLRTLGIVALSAGGASLGGALVYELLRQNAEQRAESEHVQIRLAEDLDTMESRRTAARALGGIGGGLAVVGAVLLVVNPSDPPVQDRSAQVKVAVTPSGVTGAVFGRF